MLTLNAFKELLQDGSMKGKNIIVQLIEFDLDNIIQTQKQSQFIQYLIYLKIIKSASISDGFAKHEVVIIENALELLVKEFSSSSYQKFKPIVAIKEWKCKVTNYMILIQNWVILERNYSELVGYPIDLKEFQQKNNSNPKGSNIYNTSRNQQQKDRISVKIVEQQRNQNQEQEQQQQLPKAGSSVKISKDIQKNKLSIIQLPKDNDKSSIFIPISALYPNITDFKIKARITQKTPKKEFQNRTRNEKSCFFSIDVLDEDGTSISCTFFGNSCNKFFDVLQVGKVYAFSGGYVKVQSKKYGSNNPYQITFEEKSSICELPEDNNIKAISFDIVPIKQIKTKQVNDMVDVLGIVLEDTISQPVNTRSGQQTVKRSLILYDNSSEAIEVTLWGELAEKSNLKKNDLVCLKMMRVTEFMNDKQLSSGASGQVILDINILLEIEEFQVLQKWFLQTKGQVEISRQGDISYQKLKFLSQVEEEMNQHLNFEESKQNSVKVYSQVRAYLMTINQLNKMYYPACQKCTKKINDLGGNQWHCDSCNIDLNEPNYKFILTAKICDETGQLWATLHDNLGVQLLNINANEFVKLSESNKTDTLRKCTYKANSFLLLSRIENYQGQSRPRHLIIKVLEDDFLKETQDLYKLVIG